MAKPGKEPRTTVSERVARVVNNARANADGPADSQDFARAGRGAAYIVTGNDQYAPTPGTDSLVQGVPHYSRKVEN